MSEESRRVQWQRRMARFRELGLTVSAFCRAEGVSVWSFYHWRKRLAAVPGGPAVLRSGFTPVQLVVPAQIVVRLRGGTQLEIPAGDTQTVQAAIAALVRAGSEQAGGEAC